MNSLGHLPLELVQLILTHIDSKKDLYQIALINKLFNIAVTPKLWHSPTATSLSICLQLSRTYPDLHPIPLGHYIRQLVFNRSDLLVEPGEWLAHIPFLKTMDLHCQKIPNSYLGLISQHCPKLRSIHVSTTGIRDEAIALLGGLQLREVELNTCTQLTHKTLMALKNCPLERLDINYCQEMMTIDSATHILTFHHLTRLRITTLGTVLNCGDKVSGVYMNVRRK